MKQLFAIYKCEGVILERASAVVSIAESKGILTLVKKDIKDETEAKEYLKNTPLELGDYTILPYWAK